MDWQKQLQEETRNIEVWGISAPYIRGLTVIYGDAIWNVVCGIYMMNKTTFSISIIDIMQIIEVFPRETQVLIYPAYHGCY